MKIGSGNSGGSVAACFGRPAFRADIHTGQLVGDRSAGSDSSGPEARFAADPVLGDQWSGKEQTCDSMSRPTLLVKITTLVHDAVCPPRAACRMPLP